MEEIEYPEYPEEGDSLLGWSCDGKLNAVISISRFDEAMWWFTYTEGYREAAEAIFRHVDETRLDQDLLVYPILFLWHHHIELRLKELICRCQNLTGLSKDCDFKHDLTEFWETVKKHITTMYPEYADDPEIARVGKVIEELTTLNGNRAHALRYPEKREKASKKKDYEFAFAPGIEHINLGMVNEVMCRCANKLRSISDWLSALKEYRDEQRGSMVE